MFHIGIDLGGTKIEGVVLDHTHQVIARKRIATEQEKGYTHILNRIKALYNEMSGQINHSPHTLGLGTPGAVSHQTGLLKNSNTLCLNQKPISHDLEVLLKRSLQIENDANCFTLAEALHGAGQNKKLIFGVIIGTGCGGGIAYNGELLGGLQSIAGEWGHSSIDPNGPLCYCGQKGCIETFISGSGLEKIYHQKLGHSISAKQIMQQYRTQDPNVVPIVKDFFHHFGRSLANLINTLDPDIIVLGGGLSNIPELYTEGIVEVKKMVFSDSLDTPIVQYALGDSAGVIGAALIGKQKSF